MNLLKPSANRRRNELIGLVWLTAAILMLLSLLSFSEQDRSFHTSSPATDIRNWVGTLGAYTADLLYQVFGISALFLPFAFGWTGWNLVRSRETKNAGSRITGAILFFFSIQAGLALVPYPLRLFDLYPAGGLMGGLFSELLRGWLNRPGSAVFLLLITLASLYLMTAFSMERVASALQGRFSWAGKLFDIFSRLSQGLVIRLRWTRKAKPSKDDTQLTPAAMSRLERLSDPATAEWDEPDPALQTAEGIPVSLPMQSRSSVAASRPGTVSRTSQNYKLPRTSILLAPEEPQEYAIEDLKRRAGLLTAKCQEFNVHGRVTQINPGPVVTTFEFKPEAGIKYNRITNLVEDLCLALEAKSILIERIPGKSTVGIEIPNDNRETIRLREILESDAFQDARSALTLTLGKEINGKIRVADLASMPHLLIAGSTGAGKSVAINSLIISILYKATPEDVKLILVDPKRLELGLYEGIPHLVTPIITDPKVAANALRNCVKEMERRLKLLAEKGVRNIAQYNKLFDHPESLNLFEEPDEHQRLPFIVIFIDELADLMMVDSSNVEFSITRLAQMARAVGIHLVLATQRPSVDVITGLIKANFPSRISFRVATKVDSRTILDTNGAEVLLGNGDMLYSPPGSGRLVRVHGALVTEAEITQVVDFWRAQSEPTYSEEFLKAPADNEAGADADLSAEQDALYDDAVRTVLELGKASTSILQRRLRLGYGRAARILDAMERDGIIGPPDGSRPREILKRPDWHEEFERSRTEA